MTHSICRSRVREVEDLNMPFRGADDHKRVYDVHRVTPLGQVHSRDWVRLAEIPVLSIHATPRSVSQNLNEESRGRR